MVIRHLIVLLVFVSLGGNTYSQSPYRLNTGCEIGLWAGNGLLFGASRYMSHQLKPLTDTQIAKLSTDNLWPIDRTATDNNNTNAAHRSDMLIFAASGLSLAAVLSTAASASASGNKGSEALKVGLLYAESCMTSLAIVEIVKNTVHRSRPLTYNPNIPLSVKQEKDSRRSFYSGHTSFTAINTFFAAKVFADYYPESHWKPYVWGTAAAIPLWTAIERYRAGKHFPTDVATGYLLGASCGILIPYLHRAKDNGAASSSLGFAPNAMVISFTF